MATMDRVRGWVKENAPMLTVLYENKYLGMFYDRFASLPPKQQKQVLLGSLAAVAGVFFLYFFVSYLSLWSSGARTQQAYSMVDELGRFQRTMREKTMRLVRFEQEAGLGTGGLKELVNELARSASISPRLVETTEKPPVQGDGPSTKSASVRMQRVTLSQWVSFLKAVEGGNRPISISRLRAVNDDKLRGYMTVELDLSMPVFGPSNEGGPPGEADAS